MWIKDLQDQLNSHAWGQTNYRLYKTELIKLVQDALATFSPMKQDTYFNNPIQLIDFTCAGIIVDGYNVGLRIRLAQCFHHALTYDMVW